MFPVLSEGLGPLADPPALLLALVVIAAVLVVGRVVLALAWRLVVIGVIAVATLWILGILGFRTGLLASLGAL